MSIKVKKKLTVVITVIGSLFLPILHAEDERDPVLAPYVGISNKGVDTTTLKGKVMTGYQGWFNCKGDGASLGWSHWGRGINRQFGHGNVTVDLWPDMNEAGPSERFETGFKHADGSNAVIFSSYHRDTVVRHFKWMREYGIDGAFIQRFAAGLTGKKLQSKNVVLANAREGANREGRAYAVMYDLSGLEKGGTTKVLDDWKMLREKMKIGDDAAYLHHNGKPLVAIWGIGFSGSRKYTLGESRQLIEDLKREGCAIMLGIPSWWRTLERDAVTNPYLHGLLAKADVLSPWTPGRYEDPESATKHAEETYPGDMKWCAERKIDFMPVVFPGFSWNNRKPESKLDKVPRLKGNFLWSQFVAAKRTGAEMVYVAMFDEVDEATAIFKCTNNPPVGPHPFLTYEGLPSDHYLWLTGEGGKLIRGEQPISDTIPIR